MQTLYDLCNSILYAINYVCHLIPYDSPLLGTKGADKALKAITKTKKVTKAVDRIDDVSDAGKIISKVDDVVAEPILGRKIEYIMGNATGNIHNIERSLEMEKTLNSIGIFDNKAGRTLVKNAFEDAHANIDKGVLDHRTGRTSVDTLLSGPNGFAKMTTVWDGNKLVTVNLYKQNWKTIIK